MRQREVTLASISNPAAAASCCCNAKILSIASSDSSFGQSSRLQSKWHVGYAVNCNRQKHPLLIVRPCMQSATCNKNDNSKCLPPYLIHYAAAVRWVPYIVSACPVICQLIISQIEWHLHSHALAIRTCSGLRSMIKPTCRIPSYLAPLAAFFVGALHPFLRWQLGFADSRSHCCQRSQIPAHMQGASQHVVHWLGRTGQGPHAGQ